MGSSVEVPRIIGERVVLRGPVVDDVDGRRRCGQHPEIVRMFGGAISEARELTSSEAQHWFDELVAEHNPYHWVVEHEGEFIGTARLHSFDESTGTARYAVGILDPDRLGIGLGTEVTTLILAFAFDRLGLRRVDLRVLEFNARAIRCYETCGFVLREREERALLLDGRWHDDLIMAAVAPV
jgi:[ribosomal protein S5]-alanine N-acetyltransferase